MYSLLQIKVLTFTVYSLVLQLEEEKKKKSLTHHVKIYDVKVSKSEADNYCEGKSGSSLKGTVFYIKHVISLFTNFLIVIHLITFPY